MFYGMCINVKILQIKLNENLETDDQLKISGLEYGCQMIVQYGVRLKLISPTTETQSVEKLCRCTARALIAQQHNTREFFINRLPSFFF